MKKIMKILTSLILEANGKKPDRQTTPANGVGLIKPVKIAITPPINITSI
jgi:hypothetical protein